jgi:hypothetical protein
VENAWRLSLYGHTWRETHTHVVMPSLADSSLSFYAWGWEGHQLAGFDGAGSNLLLLYVTGLSNLRKNIQQFLPMSTHCSFFIIFESHKLENDHTHLISHKVSQA